MTTTLTWTKPDYRHVATTDHGTYTAARSAGRFYLGYTPKGTPATEDIGKGTLAKCKEMAEEHHNTIVFHEGNDIVDAAYDRACTCLPEIESSPTARQTSHLPCPAEVEEMLAGDPRFDPPHHPDVDRNPKYDGPPDEMAQYDDPCEGADQLVRGPTPAFDRTQDNALTVESLADGLAYQLSRRPDAGAAAPGVFRRLGKSVARMVRRALSRRGRADLAALPRAS